jgi:predicted DNA-binding transcriptional regulator AlpA
MDGMTVDAVERRVNLSELAYVVGLSDTTLQRLIRDNPDFPCNERGSNGVPYQFEVDAVAAWLKARKDRDDDHARRRKEQLAQYRLELFGENDPNAELADLSPADRRAEIAARFDEDRLRRARGELIDRDGLVASLGQAIVAVRSDLERLPEHFAREVNLSRADRVILDRMLRARLAALADRFAAIDGAAPGRIDAAA